MHWYDTDWFREWLNLAKRSYQGYTPGLFYDIPPKPESLKNLLSLTGRETCEAQGLPRKQNDD